MIPHRWTADMTPYLIFRTSSYGTNSTLTLPRKMVAREKDGGLPVGGCQSLADAVERKKLTRTSKKRHVVKNAATVSVCVYVCADRRFFERHQHQGWAWTGARVGSCWLSLSPRCSYGCSTPITVMDATLSLQHQTEICHIEQRLDCL